MRKKGSSDPEANAEARQDTHMFSDVPPVSQGASEGGGQSLTPLDIQNKEFRVARMGGYRMRDVDEFLDELTDSLSALIAENDKLRNAQGGGGQASTDDATQARRDADRIVSDARGEASQIVAEARAQSAPSAGGTTVAATPTPSDVVAVRTFLRKERDFLRSLGSLVQGHAEEMKGLARSARPEAIPLPSATPASSPASGAASAAATPTTAATAAATAMPSGDDEDAVAPKPRPEPEPEATVTMSREELGVDDPVLVAEPEPAASRGSDERSGEGSLRDLFWGEEG